MHFPYVFICFLILGFIVHFYGIKCCYFTHCLLYLL